MSLLDQLSSLCLSSINNNYHPSYDSFSINIPLVSNVENQPQIQQITFSSSNTVKQPTHNSQKKFIKLFDDEELKSGWRFVKTDKKCYNQSKITLKEDQNLSQFTVELYSKQNKNQNLLKKLTKTFYIYNAKLRKINYEFFVRLQNYTKTLKKQNEQKDKQKLKQKMKFHQKAIQKLSDTFQIICLKYFRSDKNYMQDNQTVIEKKTLAFDKIRQTFQVKKKLSLFERSCKKFFYRQFWTKLLHCNKVSIKFDLLIEILKLLIKKKNREGLKSGFQKISSLYIISRKQQYMLDKINQNSTVDRMKFQNRQNSCKIFSQKSKQSMNPFGYYHTNYQKIVNEAFPGRFYLLLKNNSYFVLETPMKLIQQKSKQNIPLKLHGVKSHEEQINLNDYIDNGHLLMNQIKNNKNFKQQLENLTISNINSKTSNFSVNTSILAETNLIIPQFDCKYYQHQPRPITMRKKPKNDGSKPDLNLIKEIKKSRKSLLITKRKQQRDAIPCETKVLINQKQKCAFDSKKTKSATNSSSKISQKYQDKQIIKKMLDQLNKQFSTSEKVKQINLSNKKQPVAKKQNSASSNKRIQRKKIKSQNGPATNFVQIIQKRSSDKKQPNHIELSTKKYEQNIESQEIRKNIKRKPCQNYFMQVTLNNRLNNKNYESNEKTIDKKNKQKADESWKKSINKCNYQNIDQTQISKILSKYRSKIPPLPERSLKIDLISSKVNKPIIQKSEEKQPNKIFFNENMHAEQQQCKKYGFSEKLLTNNPKSSKIDNTIFDDSFLIKRNSCLNFSSQTDSAFKDYLNEIPAKIFFQQSEDQNDSNLYGDLNSTLIFNKQIFNSNDDSTGLSKIKLKKPNTMNKSIQKNIKNLNLQMSEWNMMLQKSQNCFYKNDKQLFRKNNLNEVAISEIKNKIQHCLILNQKDTNIMKANIATLTKTKKF